MHTMQSDTCHSEIFYKLLDLIDYNVKNLRVFWSRPRQLVTTTSDGDECRNIITSLSKLALGARQPVASHIRSHPRSMLVLSTATHCPFWTYYN